MTTTIQNQNKITRRVSCFNEYLSGTYLPGLRLFSSVMTKTKSGKHRCRTESQLDRNGVFTARFAGWATGKPTW